MKPSILSAARLSFPLATAIAALLATQSVHATTYYWDSTAATGAFADPGFGSAAGTWAATSTSGNGRWVTSSTGAIAGSAAVTTAAADILNFGSSTDGLAAGTITVSGTVASGNLVFASTSGAIVLSGGTLTLSGRTITINNTTDTINSVVAGASMTKNGTGTLILGGNNTLSGTLTVANGGTLVLSGDNSSMTAVVSLSTAGTGTSAPKLNINSATAIGTGTLSFGGGAATDTVQIDNTSVGAITLSTNNVITLNRNFTFAGTQSLNLGTGTATLGGLTTGTQRSIAVTANTLTFGGIVAEATTNLGISKSGNGTLVLANTNSYTGTTTVSAGTLQLDGSTNASSTVAVGTSGTLTGTGTVNGNATLTGSGTINKSSGTIAGTLGVSGGNWNGAGAVTGLVTSSSGTFTIGNGANLTANGNLSVTGGTIAAGNSASTITGNVNYTSGTNSSFAGIIAGSGKTLTMNNAAATLTLSGANTYTGVTNVNAGFLVIGSTNALGTTAGNTVIASGGQVYMSTASLAVAEPFNIAGSGVGGTAGAIEFAGGVSGMSISGAVTLSAAATIKGDGNTGSTFTGGINNAGNALTFTVDGGATSTVSTNGISGGGSLTKASTGTLNLNVASGYSGGTQITGGIINVTTSATALGGGGVTFNGGTRLTVANGLNVANDIIIGTSPGEAGRGVLESSGTGTATLSGNITINASPTLGGIFAAGTGNNLVVSGPITASVAVTQRTGTVTFSGGGTGYTVFTNSTGITKVGALNGIATTASVTINSSAGAGSLDLNGFNQSLVGISRGSASFTSIIGNSSTTTDSTLTTTGTSSFAGVIQDKDALGVGARKVALNVNGGAFTLSGINTFSGGTTLTSGRLNLNSAGSGGTSSAIGTGTFTINGGSIDNTSGAAITLSTNNPININSDFTFVGGNGANSNLTFGSGAVTLNADHQITVGTGATLTFGGDITGTSYTLTKAGAGTLVLNGSSAYTGATQVNNGVLSIGNVGALNSGSGVTLANGTSLVYTGGDANLTTGVTVSSGTGTIQNTGGGTLNLGGTLDKTGAVLTLKSGIFNVNGAITGNTGSPNSDLVVDGATVNLNTANTYNGPTYIKNAGTLNATVANALPTVNGATAIHIDETGSGGSTLSISFDQTIASLNGGTAGNSTVAIDNKHLTVGDSTNTTYSGTFTGGGSGELIKQGSGTLTLSGDSNATNFNGIVRITDGAISINQVEALGKRGTVRTLYMTNGGTLQTSASMTFNTRVFDLGSGGGQFDVASGTTLTVGATTGTIQGAGGLTKKGDGSMVIKNANTYSGGTNINAGTLQIDHADALGTSGTIAFGGGTLKYGSGITADLSGRFSTAASQAYKIDTNGNDVTLATDLASSGGTLTKSGAGTLTIGTSSYTGATAVNGGKLVINGSVSTAVTVNSGGTLGGTATVGAVTIASGGFITPGNSPGTVVVNGDYVQAGEYTADIAGTTPGSGYDQIDVTGTVDITGGSLVTMFSGAGYTTGDLLFILSNDGINPITGTYAGYAQGAVVASYGGFDWQISYAADTTGNTFTGGNDIALIAVPEPRAALLGGLGMLALLRRRRN